jgi:RNA polymerase sigma-70 factor, ECF subfamily
MGMTQAQSSNVRPTAGGRRLLVTVRSRRARGFDLRASRQLNFERTAASPGVSDDWAIVQQAISGDAEAHENLFARYTGRLYRTAFAVLRNKEDAEDALQNGLCKAFTSLRSFQGRSSFSTWLTRIVINAALMIRRKNNVHPEASLDEILDGQPERLRNGAVDARPSPEKICASIEFKAHFEDHVRQLPPVLQAAFRLRVINGLSATESSQALGIPANTFKSRIFRARQKLTFALQRSL